MTPEWQQAAETEARCWPWLSGLLAGLGVELVAGYVALVGPGRAPRGLARNSRTPPGHLAVVGAEVFQVPAARAGVRVASLGRLVAH